MEQEKNLKMIPQEVHNGWKRIDRHSCWEEYLWERLPETKRTECAAAIAEARVVCAVDWSGGCAWRSVPSKLVQHHSLLYLNFRVFASGVKNSVDTLWYHEMEVRVLQDAEVVVVLSETDRLEISGILKDEGISKPMHVLSPPLRSDILGFAIQEDSRESLHKYLPQAMRGCLQQHPNRRFLICVVRLSPEKEALRFANLVEKLKDTIRTSNMIPVLAGACADQEYANRVTDRLRKAAPDAIILSSFLNFEAMAALLAHATINVHPCSYDSYGMTCVEAAAFGVPSIIAAGNQVGATFMLGSDGFIPTTMSGEEDLPDLSKVLQLWNDPLSLKAIGDKARERALGWNENAYGEGFLSIASTLH